VAAMLPADWQLRLVDLNTGPLTESHWEWAEVVLFSAMGVQKPSLISILIRFNDY